MELSSESSNNINNNIKIEDILTIYKDEFIDLSSLSHKFIKNHTCINISENIKLLGNLYFFDIWMDTKTQILLLGFPNSPIKSWYKIKKIEELNNFINYFTNVKKYDETINIFIDYLDFNNIIKYLYTNKFVKNISTDLKNLDNNKIDIELLDNFINEANSNDEFYIKTLYSESILYFKKTKSHILINIKFQKLLLRNRYELIDKYIPSDINIILNKYNVIKLEDAIINNITTDIIDLCFELKDKSYLRKLLEIIINNNKDEEIKKYISIKISEQEINNIFLKIEKDKIFKSFENSMDILLQTIYERTKEYSSNMLYINEKIKTKIIDIITNKIIL